MRLFAVLAVFAVLESIPKPALANGNDCRSAWRSGPCSAAKSRYVRGGIQLRSVVQRSGMFRAPQRALARGEAPRSASLTTRRGSTVVMIKKAARQELTCNSAVNGYDLRIVEAFLGRVKKDLVLTGLVKNYSDAPLRSDLRVSVTDADSGATRRYTIDQGRKKVGGMLPFEIILGPFDLAKHTDKIFQYQLLYDPIRYCQVKSIEVNPNIPRGVGRLVSGHINADQIAANIDTITADFHDLQAAKKRSKYVASRYFVLHTQLMTRFGRACPGENIIQDTLIETRCKRLGDLLQAQPAAS